MEQSNAVCNKILDIGEDINVNDLKSDKIRNEKIAKICAQQPYYSKLIYLEIRIKKFLKKRKIKVQQKRMSKEDKYDNNPNVFIYNTNASSLRANNNNNNNNDGKNSENVAMVMASILIPTVKADLKECFLFINDPFSKTIHGILEANDPRHKNNPNMKERKRYPKVFEDNFSYTGEWKNAKRDGIGILTNDICKYIGNFKDDAVFGFGKLIKEEGDIYMGFWNNNQASGIGTFKT